MAYIDPLLLNMARLQANAIREKRELPYKAPYKYTDCNETEHTADPKWFDEFCEGLAKHEDVKLHVNPVPNEQSEL